MIDNGKQKALEAAMAQIEKAFGKGSIMRFGDKKIEKMEAISTGSLTLDCALGIGGFPEGRIVEISGEESSGKTTLALHVIAEAQKKGGICAFVDAEHALDINYAKKIGVKVEDLLISQPDSGEQALEIVDSLVRSGVIKCVVIDSVAALVPKAELEGDMGASHMGLQARLMSQALRKLTGSISKTGCLVIFINQVRQKIGVMFGDPETTTGGVALKFYASVRIKVKPLTMIKKDDKVIGREIALRIIKNKCFAPGAVAKTVIMYGVGISKVDELVDYALSFDIIKKAGSWYSIGDEKIGQGRDAAILYMKTAPQSLIDKITDKAKQSIGLMINEDYSKNELEDQEDDVTGLSSEEDIEK
ncbi:recombinase RecA [Alphaproteobacteria bacterium endosymbiont of Tiliacea citrago]|uniref:recombinase RecA n=1 Tax=Alphaproteobacteria bacterium endosymbiont of Tiliacea citrago TaxID=3077944 RepID=UPI00313D1E00